MRAGIQAQTFPLAWRQLQDQPRRMRRDALDDIAQIHERIDLQMLTGLHEGAQNGGSKKTGPRPRGKPLDSNPGSNFAFANRLELVRA
jgi:hypothetical protein